MLDQTHEPAAEAIARLPQGRQDNSDAADPIVEGEAAARLSQDQNTNASSLDDSTESAAEAAKTQPRGRSERADAADPVPPSLIEPAAKARPALPQAQELGADAADPIEPAAVALTHLSLDQASSATAADPLVEGEANRALSQDQRPCASSLDDITESAASVGQRMPQGQGRAADAADPIVEDEATPGLLKGHEPIASSLDDLCGRLMVLQRDRVLAIRMQSRCDRAVEAYIRIRLGFTTDPTRMKEAERKKLAAEAKRIKKAVEQGGDLPGAADEAAATVVLACSAVILRNLVARGSWDEMRVQTEREMRRLAHELPAWGFVKTVAGVSDLGLGVIVGEAGNLAAYPKKGHLWKRLGLAVIDGNRQGAPGPQATAEDWIRHGYKKARRAEVYTFLDDSMFRHQWRGAKDDAPAHPIGPYGRPYARKKAEYIAREWTPKHADNAARRYMAKMFIRDLWKAWREADAAVSLNHTLSAERHAA